MVNQTINLDPRITRLIEKKGWKSLNHLQIASIEKVKKGYNTLITAPTGYGKTEAGFLPILDKMVNSNPEPVSLIYLTPMRALINDITRRLSWWAEQLGFIVARKHGDVPQSEKNKRLRRKPHILVSTPESLKIDLDWASRFRDLYSNTRWIILDEVHEIISSKRGVQLALLLERLRESLGIDPQIIMLSATIGNPLEVAELFSGSSRRKTAIIDASSSYKSFDITIDALDGIDDRRDYWRKIAEKVVQHLEPVSIVFVTSRHGSERLQEELEKLGINDVMVHHSSISGKRKEEIEFLLKNGRIRGVISTRTLELGIDIGEINKVIIVGSPQTSYSLLQKIGRSGHRENMVSKGVIIATTKLEVLESIAATERALKGYIESQRPIKCPLDVLAREIVGIGLSGAPIRPDVIYNLARKSKVCPDITIEETCALLEYMESNGLLSRKDEGSYKIGPTFYKIWKFDRKDKKWWSREFSEFFTIISEKDSFQVRNNGSVIGELDSSFVYRHLRVGDTIRLSGKTWKIVDIDENSSKLEVISVETPSNEVPLWRGGGAYTSKEVINYAIEILDEICNTNGEKHFNIKITDTALASLKKICSDINSKIKDGLANRMYVFNMDNELIIVNPTGARINEALGYLLLFELTSKQTMNAYIKVSPYGLVVHPYISVEEIANEINSKEELYNRIRLAIKRAPLFYSILKEIQISFGIIGKASDEDGLVVEESLRQAVEASLDIDGLWKVINGIRNGGITLVRKKGEELPSVFREELISRPQTKMWFRDASLAIAKALKNWAFTEEELSEILLIPRKTLENKLKEMRKDNNGARVFRFYDVETSEWRWGLVEDWRTIIESEDFKASFTPIDPCQSFILQVRPEGRSSYISVITSYKNLVENPDEVFSSIPFEEIYELKVCPLSTGILKSMSPRYYYIPKELIPPLFANAVTVLQSLGSFE